MSNIVIDTLNDHGLFNKKLVKGKEKLVLAWENCSIVDIETGLVISLDITPKFDDYTYDRYSEEYYEAIYNGEIPPVRFLEPMSALEPDNHNVTDDDIMELKKDGHRCLLFIGEGVNRAFSKRISKKTGWYNENSDQIPHIRDLDLSQFKGTVLDGELVWGKDSMDCQKIAGSLPENAIQNQWEAGAYGGVKWAKLQCFDILFYKGVNISKMPLWKRKIYLDKVITFIENLGVDYITFLDIYATKNTRKKLISFGIPSKRIIEVKSLEDQYKAFIADGLEGSVVKDIYGKYLFGKHSEYFRKWKGKSTWDVIIMGLTEPTKEYTGKLTDEELREWKYWYDNDSEEVLILKDGEEMILEEGDNSVPVTKPFAMGWCGGIRFGVWQPIPKKVLQSMKDGAFECMCKIGRGCLIKGLEHELVEVGVAKGISEEIMEDLKMNVKKYVKEFRVLAIEAQGIIDEDKGSLRHPVFKQWREDKDYKDCTWDKHIRKVKK